MLFSTKQEAQACVRDLTEGSRFMGDSVKVKYLGGALDPPPSPQPSKQPSPVPVPTLQLPETGEEVNIRHYSALPNAKAATEETIKMSSPPRPSAREAAGNAGNQSLLNTSGISAIENTSGWANAGRVSPPRGDKSFTLNTSHVSDFGEADVSVNQSTSLQTVQSVRAVDRSQALPAPLPQALDRSVVSRSVLHDTTHGLNDSHLVGNQSLRVQDLSMVSFAPDVQEVDAPTSYTNHSDAPHGTAKQTPSKARRYASDSSGGESPEEGEGEKYPSAPGSGALLLPTRTISPPKPQPRGPKLEDAGKLDSTGSSHNSWKSAQSSKSPDNASAKKATKKKSFGFDSADESGSEKSDTVNFASKSTGKFAKFSGGVDSKASTVMRAYAQDARDRSGSSSSEGDVRQSSQLTSVDDNGSAKYARFSTESAAGNAQFNVPNTARSQELLATPRSTTSAHSGGDQSTTSSVKKRQIRTIHVGSPLNSSDHAGQSNFSSQPEDEENYIQEEQSERMMRSRSNSEEIVLRVEKSLPSVHLHARFAEPEEEASESHMSHSRHKEESRRNKSVDRYEREASPPSKQSFQMQTSFVQESHPTTRSRNGSDGSAASSKSAPRPSLVPLDTSITVPTKLPTKHQPVVEKNPEVMRLVQSLQERLRLLEAQVNLSAESESLRKASQARSEEAWTAEIVALSIHNQQTFTENTHLQEELQRLKIEFANTQAALGAAEASKRSLLLNSEGLKDRAQHEALDTVISQKRLISALETNLAETRRQSKKLEEDLSYMKNKHCTTASSLITWKAKALELSARQTMSSAGGGTAQSLPSTVTGADRASADTRRLDDSDIMDRSLLAEVSGQRGRADSPQEEGSVEHKSAEPDTHEKVRISSSQFQPHPHSTYSASASKLHLSAHIGSVDESHIAADASREQLYPYDNTFFTDAGGNENDSQNSDNIDLNAQRRAAERITRQ